jgi:hypothetical protein
MERLKVGAIGAIIFYFWLNGMADNPKEVEQVRQQMNSIVEKGWKALSGVMK